MEKKKCKERRKSKKNKISKRILYLFWIKNYNLKRSKILKFKIFLTAEN